MTYRKLDKNGDYSHGAFHKNSVDAVAQAVMTRLKLWTGEWFIDTQEGTPYMQKILGKYTLSNVDSVIRERILKTEGVIEIIDFTSYFNSELRNYSINVKISTIYGEGLIDGVI